MVSREWCAVLVAAVLVAGAYARPGGGGGDGDDAHVTDLYDETNKSPQLAISEQETNEVTNGKTKTEERIDKFKVKAENDPAPNVVNPGEGPGKQPVAKLENYVKLKETKTVNERFPYAVLYGGTCGGTIISPTWILTAAHCTLFSVGVYVLAGTDNSENSSGHSRRVKRLVIHPRFSVGPYWLNAASYDIKQVAAYYDFMLAELENPLPLDGKTMVAAQLDDQLITPVGLEVEYGGYGAEHHGETMRHNMHGMQLQVQPDSKCKKALPQYNREDMLCTQGRPPRFDSACNGDSGSGLMANGTVYGVASWVEDDAHRCFNGALVVFSRVARVRDWIRQVTKI